MSYQLTVTLNEKQITILKHLAAGMSYKEISQKLATNTKDIENKVAVLLELFDCRNSRQLVGMAVGMKIISHEPEP